MFNNELMADVHFIVGPLGDSQTVPAHKVKTSYTFLICPWEEKCQTERWLQFVLWNSNVLHTSREVVSAVCGTHSLPLTELCVVACVWRACPLLPPLSVRAGRGKLRVLCHVLRRSGGGGSRDPHPRRGTCFFSNSAEVSHSPSLTQPSRRRDDKRSQCHFKAYYYSSRAKQRRAAESGRVLRAPESGSSMELCNCWFSQHSLFNLKHFLPSPHPQPDVFLRGEYIQTSGYK